MPLNLQARLGFDTTQNCARKSRFRTLAHFYNLPVSLAQLAINLIIVVPFLAGVCAIVMAIRAVVKGEVASGGGRYAVRMISRSVHPIHFWIEIGLYGAAGMFLVLLGLLLMS